MKPYPLEFSAERRATSLSVVNNDEVSEVAELGEVVTKVSVCCILSDPPNE